MLERLISHARLRGEPQLSEEAGQGGMLQAPYFLDWLSTTWKPILSLLILTIVWYFLSTYPSNIIAEFIYPQIRGAEEELYHSAYFLPPMVDHPLKESTAKNIAIGTWAFFSLITVFVAIKKTLLFNYQRRIARNPRYLTIQQRYGKYAALWFSNTLKTHTITLIIFSFLYLWATPISNVIAQFIYPQVRGAEEKLYHSAYFLPPMVDHPLKDNTAYWISIATWASIIIFYIIAISMKTLAVIRKLPKKTYAKK